MANQEHLSILEQGIEVWNRWREEYPNIAPDLSESSIIWADLGGANFNGASLTGAFLTGSDLGGAYFREANLNRADLSGANLYKAILNKADLGGTDLTEANLYHAMLMEAYLGGAVLVATDLRGAYLDAATLWGANLSGANLSGASLSLANLSRADLTEANLTGADLTGVDLSRATLVETILDEADLIGANIYGISVWNVKKDELIQEDLIITPPGEPIIIVDDLEVAQFIFLLLNNEKIRSVIDTIGEKAVLILGRFTEERKAVLDAIRDELRQSGFVPIMFDFERPTQRDFTETIKTLAGLSRFIIADITNPKSSPLELQAIMPDYMIPFVPIIQENEEPFAMFQDLKQKYGEWVLDVLEYDSVDNLINVLDKAVVKPALEMADQLMLKKAETIRKRHVADYK